MRYFIPTLIPNINSQIIQYIPHSKYINVYLYVVYRIAIKGEEVAVKLMRFQRGPRGRKADVNAARVLGRCCVWYLTPDLDGGYTGRGWFRWTST